MNHVDEGMIHAWLDGALDAAQSAEVDAHVQSCAECSARVAEARGLIAASSRILVSLDDVPANVIPKKAPIVARPRWRVAPWMTAAAAAVVVIAVWQKGGVERTKMAADIAIPKVEVTTSVPEQSLERLKEPAPPPSAPTAKAPAERLQSKVGNSSRVADGRAAGAGAAVGGVSDLASAQVATAPTTAASPTAAIRDMTARQDLQRREAAAAEERRASAVDVRVSRRLALTDEAVAVVGCYRVMDVKETAAAGVAETRAPERATRARGAVSSSASAPAAMQKAADADFTQGVVVRLDSLGLVRAIGSDSIIGGWVHVRADSVQARLGSRNQMVSTLNKVRCP